MSTSTYNGFVEYYKMSIPRYGFFESRSLAFLCDLIFLYCTYDGIVHRVSLAKLFFSNTVSNKTLLILFAVYCVGIYNNLTIVLSLSQTVIPLCTQTRPDAAVLQVLPILAVPPCHLCRICQKPPAGQLWRMVGIQGCSTVIN